MAVSSVGASGLEAALPITILPSGVGVLGTEDWVRRMVGWRSQLGEAGGPR
ncbi:MAG TPA: hypothetical protein VJL08_00605 [Dehalococcoidia bacterium]|nr:hypothetical protein [Dehalococcoidia bacterium]